EFKGRGQPQTPGAGWQLAFEVHQDRLGFARWDTYVHGHSFPGAVRQLRFEDREGERQGRVERTGDVRHASTEAEPAVEDQDQWFRNGEFAKVEGDAEGFSQTAQLRFAKVLWPDQARIICSQEFSRIQAIATCGSLEGGPRAERPQLMRGEWPASEHLARGGHDRAVRMVHDHQPCLVQVEHLPELFGDAQLVFVVARRELPLVSKGKILFRIRLHVPRFADGQTEW